MTGSLSSLHPYENWRMAVSSYSPGGAEAQAREGSRIGGDVGHVATKAAGFSLAGGGPIRRWL